jgi:RNA polymerase sigma factor (TIGR02999 family)
MPVDPDRSEVTRILDALGRGEERQARDLLPLNYDELRRLAAARLAQERPGQTLQAIALVHEAYLRLVGGNPGRPWHGRGHFFAAAAEAMRRILVDRARGKAMLKAGGRSGGSTSTTSGRASSAGPTSRSPSTRPRPSWSGTTRRPFSSSSSATSQA